MAVGRPLMLGLLPLLAAWLLRLGGPQGRVVPAAGRSWSCRGPRFSITRPTSFIPLRAGLGIAQEVGEGVPRLRQLGQFCLPAARVVRQAKDRGSGGALAGGVGGAVLGGLLLGPFGAVFGAQLGSSFGRQRAEDEADIAELGLDAEMVELAQRVASELAEATRNRERMQHVRATFALRVEQLEAEVQLKYNEAMEAVKAENDASARKALDAKQSLQRRLGTLKGDLVAAEQRCAALDRSVTQLEQRALQVASLLQRARGASGSQRTALAAEASALSLGAPRDPLLDRFEALERGMR